LVEPTIWHLKPHTKAKHEILKKYLAAWFPILSSYSGRIVYIDGFAGPGIYSDGEEGSPLIAIRTAYEHMLKGKFREIAFLFIEKRPDRADKLDEVLKEKFPDLPNDKIKYFIESEEFGESLKSKLDALEKEGQRLAPTFAFIDPFGYTGFSMELLERIMSHKKCEVFITFMSGFMKRFLDEGKEESLNALFNTNKWENIREKSGYRDEPLLELYEKQLKECCNVKYVKNFKMINKFNQVIYHLIFCTNSLKGLEEMKKAMWNVDRTGEYKFSDRWDQTQTYIFDFQDEAHWIPNAAEQVYDKFKGTSVSVEDVSEYVIANTNYIFIKAILRYIEDNNPERINSVQVESGRKRRKRTFPPGCIIHFN